MKTRTVKLQHSERAPIAGPLDILCPKGGHVGMRLKAGHTVAIGMTIAASDFENADGSAPVKGTVPLCKTCGEPMLPSIQRTIFPA